MQQGGDYGASYYAGHQITPPPATANPNSRDYNPSTVTNLVNPSFASAPPYSQFSAPDQSSFNYTSYAPQTIPYSGSPGPASNPSAPLYSLPLQPQTQSLQFQPYLPFNPPPVGPEQQQPSAYPHLQQLYSTPNFTIPYPNSVPNPPSYAPYSYENLYENSTRYGGAAEIYSIRDSGYDRELDDRNPESASRYDWGGVQDERVNDGAYRYDGGGLEPYAARGTGGSRSASSLSGFDDYGRALSFGSGAGKEVGGGAMVVRVVPKVETQPDLKSGVQKFRVKLLPEGSGSSTDVLCQIGLDGIHMLDPSSSRTLRIYPLETVTRSEVNDPSVYTFWSKTSMDIEPRRIRLQSNSHTTNTLLDTVTAATAQLKEMDGKGSFSQGTGSNDANKHTDQPPERKKGLAWMNFIKQVNEEKDHWVPDEAVKKCTSCGADFNAFNRRHHCRNCGDIFCDKCTQGRIVLTADDNTQPVRVCDRCMAEVTQRLSRAKDTMNKPARLHTHEDLAKKLQEEMERNRKSTSGSKSSNVSGTRTREVACPTCTVHLQVQVPSSGSETIECGVCQHPFLVSAR